MNTINYQKIQDFYQKYFDKIDKLNSKDFKILEKFRTNNIPKTDISHITIIPPLYTKFISFIKNTVICKIQKFKEKVIYFPTFVDNIISKTIVYRVFFLSILVFLSIFSFIIFIVIRNL